MVGHLKTLWWNQMNVSTRSEIMRAARGSHIISTAAEPYHRWTTRFFYVSSLILTSVCGGLWSPLPCSKLVRRSKARGTRQFARRQCSHRYAAWHDDRSQQRNKPRLIPQFYLCVRSVA